MTEIKIGDVFKNWTVKEILQKVGKHQFFIIECSCGQSERKMEKYQLKKWDKDYCIKCKPREDKSGIEIGGMYGNWLVLYKDEKITKERQESSFLCECQCENKTQQILNGYTLKSGLSTKCMKCAVAGRKNEIRPGDKFGHWIVIKEDGRQYTNIMYLCECDCEFKTQRRQRANYLVNGGSEISCQECCQYNRSENGRLVSKPNLGNRTGIGPISGQYIAGLKIDAARRNLSYNVANEYIYELFVSQKSLCFLTGMHLQFSNFDRQEQTASLDRINNNDGYQIGNLRWVNKDVNLARGKLDDSNYLYFCRLIIEHTYKKFEPIDYQVREHGNQWEGVGDLGKTAWTEVEKRARDFNRELELTIEDGWELAKSQGFRCALTGLPLDFGYKVEGNISLDRIDSNKGYTKDNVQWVHKTVNRMKWHLDQNYFIWLCRQVYEYSILNSNIYSFI